MPLGSRRVPFSYVHFSFRRALVLTGVVLAPLCIAAVVYVDPSFRFVNATAIAAALFAVRMAILALLAYVVCQMSFNGHRRFLRENSDRQFSLRALSLTFTALAVASWASTQWPILVFTIILFALFHYVGKSWAHYDSSLTLSRVLLVPAVLILVGMFLDVMRANGVFSYPLVGYVGNFAYAAIAMMFAMITIACVWMHDKSSLIVLLVALVYWCQQILYTSAFTRDFAFDELHLYLAVISTTTATLLALVLKPILRASTSAHVTVMSIADYGLATLAVGVLVAASQLYARQHPVWPNIAFGLAHAMMAAAACYLAISKSTTIGLIFYYCFGAAFLVMHESTYRIVYGHELRLFPFDHSREYSALAVLAIVLIGVMITRFRVAVRARLDPPIGR